MMLKTGFILTENIVGTRSEVSFKYAFDSRALGILIKSLCIKHGFRTLVDKLYYLT